jgi:hypothetical protein
MTIKSPEYPSRRISYSPQIIFGGRTPQAGASRAAFRSREDLEKYKLTRAVALRDIGIQRRSYGFGM